MLVIWREFKGKNMGNPIPPWLPHASGALLLQQVQSMPKEGKQPIRYDNAMNAFGAYCLKFFEDNHHDLDAWMADRKLMERELAESRELANTFVAWLTQQGYWLELQGDEFEIIDDPHQAGAA